MTCGASGVELGGAPAARQTADRPPRRREQYSRSEAWGRPKDSHAPGRIIAGDAWTAGGSVQSVTRWVVRPPTAVQLRAVMRRLPGFGRAEEHM